MVRGMSGRRRCEFVATQQTVDGWQELQFPPAEHLDAKDRLQGPSGGGRMSGLETRDERACIGSTVDPADGIRGQCDCDASTARPGAPLIRLASLIVHELWASRPVLTGLLAGLLGYGVGHAAFAVAVGLIGKSLVAGAGGGPLQGWSLLDVSYVGLGAVVVKASAVVLLTYSEARLAGRVADRARGRAVSALLHFGLHDVAPRVHATIAVRIRELEA